jgi:hypothetical protein
MDQAYNREVGRGPENKHSGPNAKDGKRTGDANDFNGARTKRQESVRA